MDYLGFYWTFPVNWAGFTALPSDVDQAAGASRTIRYQVERVRRWVKEDKGRLLKEVVFMDTRPDRGTDAIESEVSKLLAEAARQNAQLVLVDFAQAFGWRPHGPLFEIIGDTQRCVLLPPDPVVINGKWWDPVAHFRAWRNINLTHQVAKDGVKKAAKEEIVEMKGGGATYAAIAVHLNESGLSTANGRPWSADNVRKFIASG